MKRTNRWMAAVIVISVALLYYKSTQTIDTPVKTEPAKVELIEGTELKRVTLTDKAAERLGIETVSAGWAKLAKERAPRLVVPYASVIYDLNGETWVYTSPESLTFVRHRIEVDYISADLAVLTSGPEVGTEIVTVGVAELYGIETGVGK